MNIFRGKGHIFLTFIDKEDETIKSVNATCIHYADYHTNYIETELLFQTAFYFL